MKFRILLPWFCLLFLQGALAYVEAVAGSFVPPSHFEPQVAIYCGGKQKLHNQYLDESGRWVSDLDPGATCTTDKVQILEYCKKVYPKRDITNIVESSHFFKIDNWCRFGQKKCKQAQWVKPYRCLEGPFQSDALLVPEHCLFDHVHNQSKCLVFDSWNQTAAHSCSRREMTLRSFAMLLPCGIDVFSGVEFVCCPPDKDIWKAKDVKTIPVIASKLARLEQVDSQEITPGSSPSPPPSSESSSSESDSLESSELDDDSKEQPTESSISSTTPDYYFSHFDSKREHEEFKAAERRLEERHREKVTKVMKDWSELEEKYQEMKTSDPRGAEVFKKNMTAGFQKTVAALEYQGTAEKKQLLGLHQQRVQHAINERKREAMDCYTHALNAKVPKTQKIQKCLEKLIRALEKDRTHTIGHFKHLLNTNFRQATNEKAATLERLAEIDHALNTSLTMLERVPEVANKIRDSIMEFVQSVRSNSHDHLPVALQTSMDGKDALIEMYKAEQAARQLEKQKEKEKELAREKKIESKEAEESKEDEEEESEESEVGFEPETTDDLSLPSQHLPQPKVAHAQRDVPQHQQTYQLTSNEAYHRRRNSTASIITLGFFCFALLAAILVGVALLRRRSHNQSGLTEVNQAATPEERHVTSMQVNGYENPTYKYFETKE